MKKTEELKALCKVPFRWQGSQCQSYKHLWSVKKLKRFFFFYIKLAMSGKSYMVAPDG